MPPAQSASLLSALSSELAGMAGAVESLSAVVADHVRQSRGEARARALVEAQTIDALSQRLIALSGVTGALARGADVDTALADVRLADLSQRLRGAALTPPVPSDRPVAGDLVLFE